MHSIEIDDEVFTELSRRATGFNITPNSVIRRVLNLPESLNSSGASQPIPRRLPSQPAPLTSSSSKLVEFIRSDLFLRQNQAIDRFLLLLGWLHLENQGEFADAILRFRKGSRAYFSKSQKEIEKSGSGIIAKPIPHSPFWVLTTLDNKSKRIVIEDILRLLKYSRGDINLVLAELPDSGIRRSRGGPSAIDELVQQYSKKNI